MPTPTVGRIVHYVSYGTPNGEYQPEHRAAIVTEVIEYDEGDERNHQQYVHLCVINPAGFFFNHYVAHDEDEKKGGTWHWPEIDKKGIDA